MSVITVKVPIGGPDSSLMEDACIPAREIEEIRSYRTSTVTNADGYLTLRSGRRVFIKGVEDATRQLRAQLGRAERGEE